MREVDGVLFDRLRRDWLLPVQLDSGMFTLMTCTGSLGVWTNFIYPPARHEPLVVPTASASQVTRQLVVLRAWSKASPNPNPFCAGRLPAAMCSGWSVNNSIAQAGATLNPPLHASDTRVSARESSHGTSFRPFYPRHHHCRRQPQQHHQTPPHTASCSSLPRAICRTLSDFSLRPDPGPCSDQLCAAGDVTFFCVNPGVSRNFVPARQTKGSREFTDSNWRSCKCRATANTDSCPEPTLRLVGRSSISGRWRRGLLETSRSTRYSARSGFGMWLPLNSTDCRFFRSQH